MNKNFMVDIIFIASFAISFIVIVPMYILLAIKNFKNEHPGGLKKIIVEFLNSIVKKTNKKSVFKVVQGSSLKGSISGLVFGEQGRKTEEEYKQLLLDMRLWFDELEVGTKSLADDFIKNGTSAKYIFEDKAITVKYDKDGYRHSAMDGRHRFLIAQKDDLKVLVKVQPPSSLKEKYYEVCRKIKYPSEKIVRLD